MITTQAKNARPKKKPSAKKPAKNSAPHQHDDFVLMIPVIKTTAALCYRKKRPEEKEELIQECVANAFRTYTMLKEQGKDDVIYASVLAKYAVRQVREGRKVGGHLNKNEILSRYAQIHRNFRIEHLDHYDAQENEWLDALIGDPSTPLFDQVAFRVDFEDWLQKQSQKKIVEALAMGYTTSEAAQQFHVTKGRISQLRRAFEQSWNEYQGEVAEKEEELVAA